MGAGKETSNYDESNYIAKSASYSGEYKPTEKSEPKCDRNWSGIKNKSKEKRNRRKERKRKKKKFNEK